MLIRQATLTDIPQIMQLIAEVLPAMIASGNLQWDGNYPNAVVFTKDINKGQLWVAEVEGHIAGISAITTDQEIEYAQVGWDLTEIAIVTHRLAVNPQISRPWHSKGAITTSRTTGPEPKHKNIAY